MINQKGHIDNIPGTILVLVLFFIFISSFSKDTDNQQDYFSQTEVLTELHSDYTKAVIADAIQMPSLQKSCLTILHNASFNLFIKYKVFEDNRKITQSIDFLQKEHLFIKPLPVCRFYYCPFLADSEDPLILS